MKKKLIFSGSLLMAAAVVLGALGAHALKSKLTTDQLASFETGVRYHLIHALGLLALATCTEFLSSRRIQVISIMMVLGILLFSGSIYLLATRDLYGMSGEMKFLGPITPIGGLLFILCWLLLAFSALKSRD